MKILRHLIFLSILNRLIVSFNQTSGDLITGDRQRENVFNRFMANNTLGGLQWIAKWVNN